MHGERVVRVATRLMAGARRGGRDARQVRQHRRAGRRRARRCAKALSGSRSLSWPASSSTSGCWSITANGSSGCASRSTTPALAPARSLARAEFPGCALFYGAGRRGSRRRLARAEQTMRVRIARDELRHLRELSLTINGLEREIADLVAQVAPQLLAEPGFGPLTAAKLIGEIAGAQRFAQRRQARTGRRRRPDPRQLGQDQPASPGPRRQPPDQHRHPPRRCHPRPLPPRDQDLHRTQTRRRQDQPRSAPLPQTPSRPHVWHLLQPPHPDQDHRHPHQFLDIEATEPAALNRS